MVALNHSFQCERFGFVIAGPMELLATRMMKLHLTWSNALRMRVRAVENGSPLGILSNQTTTPSSIFHHPADKDSHGRISSDLPISEGRTVTPFKRLLRGGRSQEEARRGAISRFKKAILAGICTRISFRITSQVFFWRLKILLFLSLQMLHRRLRNKVLQGQHYLSAMITLINKVLHVIYDWGALMDAHPKT